MKENSEELEARIAAYIDGQLPPADAARLEVFLANTDPALAQQVITMIAERHAVRALPKPKAPDDLAARIMEQVERTTLLNDVEHFSAPHRPWWQSRLAAAAALIFILGGFSWFILEAVRRPTSAWRETVMDDGSRRDVSLASRPPAAITAAPTASATLASAAPAGPVLASANSRKVEAPSAIVADSPTAPAVDAAAQNVAAPTMSTDTVAQQPAPQSARQPLQITLVSRDSQDSARLRTTLEQFINADPEAARNQLALTGNAPVLEGQAGGGAAAQNFNLRSNTIDQQQSQSNLSQSNSNANEQLAARAAAKPSQLADKNLAGYQYYDQRQRGFTEPAANAGENRAETSAPLPYHVSLRPDQLRQLAADFKVQTISPDQSIPPAPAGAITESAATTTRLGSFANHKSAEIAAKDIADLAKEKQSDGWIDCIITLLPPPTTSPASPSDNSPAAPATTPLPAASQPR